MSRGLLVVMEGSPIVVDNRSEVVFKCSLRIIYKTPLMDEDETQSWRLIVFGAHVQTVPSLVVYVTWTRSIRGKEVLELT
jgi:hypothetical protein